LLGFAVCGTLIYYSQGSGALIQPVTALWLAAVPLMDMLATMGLRLSEGHNPMRADRRHLHHLLVDVGFSVTTARRLILLYALTLTALGIALMSTAEYLSFALCLAVFAGHCLFVLRLRNVLIERASLGGETDAEPTQAVLQREESAV
jgi:UDP-GlcNAc:undecaprenyl-phosphate/decaprenyl-phosphate GlcNAc-1-phosphate transferase